MSWTQDRTGWLMALGGAAAGFLVVRLMERRREPLPNPDGYRVFTYEMYGYTIQRRLNSETGKSLVYVKSGGMSGRERLGTIRNLDNGLYLVRPPEYYSHLSVTSIAPPREIEFGIVLDSIQTSIEHLLDRMISSVRLAGKMREQSGDRKKEWLAREFNKVFGSGSLPRYKPSRKPKKGWG